MSIAKEHDPINVHIESMWPSILFVCGRGKIDHGRGKKIHGNGHRWRI